MSVTTRLMTYDDLLQLPDDGHRYELIGGQLIVSPSPNRRHQRAVLELALPMGRFIKAHRLGQLYVAPSDVTLTIHDVVEPDLYFISRDRLLPDDHPDAMSVVPDLVIEILSPSSRVRDTTVKQSLYERLGVREFWRVDCELGAITVFVLRQGRYEVLPADNGIIHSAVLPGFTLDVAAFFTEVG